MIPETITTRTIHADIRTPAGDPADGTVTLHNAYALYDEDGSLILAPGSYTADLDDGTAEITVPATDAPGILPTGRTMRVRITAAGWNAAYDVEVPAGESPLALADLPQVVSAGSPVTYATVAALAAHAAATTDIHGIDDTAALVLEGDARLTDARDPLPHAATHAVGGDDALAAADVGAYPATGGQLDGDFVLADHDATFIRADGTGGYRVRTTGGAEGFADYDYTGQLVVWSWSGADFTGSQTGRQRWHGGGITFAGVTSFGTSVFASEQFVHGTDRFARLGGKNDVDPIQICGRTSTSGAPTTGAWDTGDLIFDVDGVPHLCTAGGTPGTWT